MKTQGVVVLADCFARAGLAVMRALSRAGLKTIVVAPFTSNLVFKSRLSGKCLLAPNPEVRPYEFATRIATIAGEENPRLVIPITDSAVYALSNHRGLFEGKVPLALPDAAAVNDVLDKARNLAIARRLHIPCPKQLELDSPAHAAEMLAEFGYPVVAKNATPDRRDLGKKLPFRVSVVRTTQELQQLLELIGDGDALPIFQEFVSGQVVNVCCFAANGDVSAMHGYISLRRSTHEGICRVIVPLDSKIESYSRRMLGALHWSGVAHLQFIVDFESGEPTYLETNGRFWASTQGSVNVDWNFPLWVYRYFVEGVVPRGGSIKLGSRTVYGKGDLQHLLIYLAGGQSPTYYTKPGKLRAVLQYLVDFSPTIGRDVWDWKDPLPAIYDYWQLFSESEWRKFVALIKRERMNGALTAKKSHR